MKEHCTERWKWSDDIETYRYSLKLWTDYYNGTKKHSGLGMAGATPSEKLQEVKKRFPDVMAIL